MKIKKIILAAISLITGISCHAEVEGGLEQLMEKGRYYRWEVYNFKKAYETFKIGAERGHPIGLSEYGQMLIDGIEPAKTNRALGYRMIKQAAELGETEAQYTLGYYLMDGEISHEQYGPDGELKPGEPVIEKDVEKALWLYREAAGKGHQLATFRLGQFYLYQFLYDKQSIEEKKKSKNEAIKWLTRGVEIDNSNCASMLGDCYLIGLCFEKDLERAKFYYEKAYGDDFVETTFSDAESFIDEVKSKY